MNVKPPSTNEKASYWGISGDGSGTMYQLLYPLS